MRKHPIAAGSYHDIDFARLEPLKPLAEPAAIRTSVSSGYADTAALAAADPLITYACDPIPGDAQTAATASLLKAGGCWLAFYGTNSALRFAADGKLDCPDENPAYTALAGSRFAGHHPIAPFKVQVARGDHPMAAGLRDFRIKDELYLVHRAAALDVLPHTGFTGTCPEFRESEWDESQVPVLYEHRVGQGRVLYLTLGHCRGHYDLQPVAPFWPHPQRCRWNNPVFYELLRRGIRWP